MANANQFWRHIVVGIVVVLWTADIIGTLIGRSAPNAYLHTIFGVVLAWVLGLEVRGLTRAINDRLEDKDDPT